MTNLINNLHFCRVCGFDCKEYFPYGEDGNSPTYAICPCCGVEWGYQDNNPDAATRCRNIWIASGAVWNDPGQKPMDWKLEAQLKNIPEGWKK